MRSDNHIDKNNIDLYLKELAKEYRRQNRHSAPVELIIVGGGSILLNYSFRTMTDDIDMFSTAGDAIEHAARAVAEKYGLPVDWVNSDFVETASYSPKLREVSKHYKTLNNGTFEIRTVSAEYLIAMKLNAGRAYKHDMSDVIGILQDEKLIGNSITSDQIARAYKDLYGHEISKSVMQDLKKYDSMSVFDLDEEYSKTQTNESRTKDSLLAIDRKYPDALNNDNINEIVTAIQKGKTVTFEDLRRTEKRQLDRKPITEMSVADHFANVDRRVAEMKTESVDRAEESNDRHDTPDGNEDPGGRD